MTTPESLYVELFFRWLSACRDYPAIKHEEPVAPEGIKPARVDRLRELCLREWRRRE